MSESDGLAFVDTNVLAYAFQKEPSPHQAPARALIARLRAEERLRISTQVLQELFFTLTRKGRQPCSPDEALAALHRGLRRDPPSGIAGPRCADFLLGCLIVAAAARSGASKLYTEDLNHGQKILGVEIVNPFAAVV